MVILKENTENDMVVKFQITKCENVPWGRHSCLCSK